MGRVREAKRRRKKIKKEKVSEKRKGRKVAKHFVFPMICGSGGSKSRLAKAAGAEPAGQMRDEKLHARRGAKHICKSKCTKHTILGPLLEVEMSQKCFAVVARSTFRSQKCTKSEGCGALLDVQMSFRVAGARDCAPCQK